MIDKVVDLANLHPSDEMHDLHHRARPLVVGVGGIRLLKMACAEVSLNPSPLPGCTLVHD